MCEDAFNPMKVEAWRWSEGHYKCRGTMFQPCTTKDRLTAILRD